MFEGIPFETLNTFVICFIVLIIVSLISGFVANTPTALVFIPIINALIDKGHSIIVIEHNIELIKCADYIIDLGLEGGKNGGKLIFQGIPEELAKNKKSYTAKYLAEKLIL